MNVVPSVGLRPTGAPGQNNGWPFCEANTIPDVE